MQGPSTPEEIDATVMPGMRQDLIVSSQVFEGRNFYIVKDPISLQYFRLSAEDYFLASLFDGKRTFAEIREAFLEQFPAVRLSMTREETTERIVRFSNELGLMQMLRVSGRVSQQRAKLIGRRKPLERFAGGLGKIFFFRFSLFDPDKLLTRMEPPLRWAWTKPAFWLSFLTILFAVFVFVQNYSRVSESSDAFFTLENFLLLWIGTILVKLIHELGHGLTCKHYGGEVHEIGVLVMLLTPFFYVNVTDSWMMPRRRDRIMVAAAGIYIELIIAALATFCWALAQPGLLQQVLFNIMVITSVWTIAFNANPLMRFDGYYILTDLMEVPNLRSKSRAYVGYLFQRLLMGQGADRKDLARLPLPKRRFGFFVLYAFCSYAYMFFIVYQISQLGVTLLEPYGLKEVGSMLSALIVFSFIGIPVIKFFANLHVTAAEMHSRGRLRRFGIAGAILAVAAAVLAVLPIEHTITRSSAITLASPQTIRPEVAARVAEVLVREGDAVQPGEVIAQLDRPELEARLQTASLRLKVGEKERRRALGTDRPVEFRQAGASQLEAMANLRQAQKDMQALTLRATAPGIVLTKNLHERRGTLARPGEVFCEISPLKSMLIQVPLSENEVRHVRKDQEVHLETYAFPGHLFTGTISQNPMIVLSKNLPPNWSAHRRGDVATTVDRQGNEVPVERVYVARILVENPDLLLRPGMTGRVKIFTGQQAFGKLVAQSFLDLLSLDTRL